MSEVPLTDVDSDNVETVLKSDRVHSIKSAKFSAVPFRLLEEDSWLSGSELKTDNSTSEDEEVRRSFTGEFHCADDGYR